jgi:tRNA (mo5U34)-methyltransferase
VLTDDIRAEIARINWLHEIDLGDGVVTPGHQGSTAKLQRIHLPETLAGLSVLDIGAWDGFFSFEAERRGARRILAIDTYIWQGNGPGSKAGFNLARRVLNSRVEDREIEVLDLSPALIGTFDVVLFLGVLYHMRHPLRALEAVYSVTNDLAIIETSVDLLDCEWPAMRFYPTDELAGDPTNWWGPNPAAVVEMLRSVGFNDIQTKSMVESTINSRMVVHARR